MRNNARNLLLCAMLCTFAAGSLSAAVIACPSSTTLNNLLAFNSAANGCFSQDKVFFGFNYGSLGPEAPPDSSVTATLIFATSPGIDIHGWTFAGNWSGNAGFTLGYSIMVCADVACLANVQAGTAIIGADAVYAPVSTAPPGDEVVNWSNGATVTLTNGSPGPLPGNGNIGYNGQGPISVTGIYAGGGSMTSTTFRFFEQVPEPTPEPATMAMMLGGVGLIGVGRLFRKKR